MAGFGNTFIGNLLKGHWENSFGGGVGSFMNDITGASNSAKTQYKNSLALQQDAQNFAKWQMANAHQMEVEDLENAGLNRVLAANGGASAGVSANSAGTGSASADPIAMIGSIVNMVNSAKKTNAEVNSLNSAAKNLTNKTNAEVRNLDADTGLTEQNTEIGKPNTETSKALQWWNSTWAGKAAAVVGDVIGRISPFTAQAINYTSARRVAKAIENNPKTHVKTVNFKK